MSDVGHFAISFSIESRLDQVRLIRAALSGVLSYAGVVESDIFFLELAVSEIVNNIFEHGYLGASDRQIQVGLQIVGQEVQIDVLDDAPPIPEELRYRLLEAPISMEDPDEEWPMRGHGLQIVRQVVDSVELSRESDKNSTILKKRVTIKSN